MRQCLFCSLTASSLEDAWPCWITKQFESSEPVSVEAEIHGRTLKPWKDRRPKLAIRAVCKSCNNGWMSRLENDVKPHLQPLLSGRNGVINFEAQATLVVWAVKTAMALEGIDSPNIRAYTQLEREQARTLNAVPQRTSVWLAMSVDPSHMESTKHRHKENEDSNECKGVSTTMGFGHVALQVFTIRVPEFVGPHTKVTASVRAGPWNDSTVRVWPPQPSSVVWPPKVGLNGEIGFDFFAKRFRISDVDEQTHDEIDL
jgi:hypothetical protein